MINMEIKGYVNSIQTLGTLDGPGVRFIVFMQGCNLRCGCCHNPETWTLNASEQYTPQEIVSKAERYREYFVEKGGITVSGGEPLLQAKFVKEIFKLCKQKGINTCLDTSGSIINEDVISLLDYTDYVLLDIKYTTDELYEKYVGCSIYKPLEFLQILNDINLFTSAAIGRGVSYSLREVLCILLPSFAFGAAFVFGGISVFKKKDIK